MKAKQVTALRQQLLDFVGDFSAELGRS